jgi:hypothetical protein
MAGFNKKHTSLVLLGFLESRPPCPSTALPILFVAPWMGTNHNILYINKGQWSIVPSQTNMYCRKG